MLFDVIVLATPPFKLIVNAYRGNHLVKRRYMIQQIDVVIAKKDSIWHDWDLCTNWLLRICKGGRENSNNSN